MLLCVQTPVHWVCEESELEALAAKLEGLPPFRACALRTQSCGAGVREFAVDLEHHSYRSYQGFVCLAQISTRDEDFLVDTLELRHHMHVLAPAFANPAIVKVLHGADRDVLWLQCDFGLYVVNMFDTGQAARYAGAACARWALRGTRVLQRTRAPELRPGLPTPALLRRGASCALMLGPCAHSGLCGAEYG